MNEYDFILKTVQDAGALLLDLREKGFSTMEKGGNLKDIVTSVDTDVNTFIIRAIREAYPEDGIYSEEGTGTESEALKKQENKRQWAIDPIDGSANFSRGIPHYAVCLGILEAGASIAGAVFNPVTKELFSFKKGEGAFLNGNPIHVSDVTELKKAHVFLHAGRKEELQTWGGESYRRLLGAVNKTSNLASSGLDTCFVAAGRIEANIYGTLSTLDISPALGILFEAGGVITDANGEPFPITEEVKRVYMANNSTMLEAVRELLEG
jgi:myo-inositol-1(or 4)-monophosphatase